MKMAFDKSARHIDEDGRLHVAKSHISKAEINPYYGHEIPNCEQLGLAPNKIYNLFRDPKELEAAVSTFARLPILSKHVPVNVEAPRSDLVIGAIGSDVAFNAPYLDADLCFWDSTAIAGIDTGQVKELSCAYRYVPVMQVGEYQGQPYDGRMTDIRGNHLALVEVGRAGSDVVVADQNPFINLENSTMKITKKDKSLLGVIKGASSKIAMDYSIDAEQLDKILDAVIGINPNSPEELEEGKDELPEMKKKDEEMPMGAADDETPAGKAKALLEGKVSPEVLSEILALFEPSTAADDVAPPMPESDKKAAMDSAIKSSVASQVNAAVAKIKMANDARLEVSKTVGEVFGMDSAEEIYSFALDQMGVERKGIKDVVALKAIYKLASSGSDTKPKIAQDSGSFDKMFPSASRITNV